jgi:AcrR family transcriptional regulator
VDPERIPAPRRRDAVETRERILRAAGEAFAARSGPPSFDAIACRAGVSRATVYRHFADRHALGVAVAERGFRALRELLAEPEPPPFRDVLHVVLATAASLGGLADLVEELPERERRRFGHRLVALLTPAFRRAQAAGELRGDVDPATLLPILRALQAAGREPDGEVMAGRLLAVLLDGLFGPRPGAAPQCVWAPGLLAGK